MYAGTTVAPTRISAASLDALGASTLWYGTPAFTSADFATSHGEVNLLFPTGSNCTEQVSELATTVSVPDRSTVLLGGLKSYDAAEGDAAPTGKPHNVLLLVRPTLIVQREVQAPQFPLLEKKGKGEGGE